MGARTAWPRLNLLKLVPRRGTDESLYHEPASTSASEDDGLLAAVQLTGFELRATRKSVARGHGIGAGLDATEAYKPGLRRIRGVVILV